MLCLSFVVSMNTVLHFVFVFSFLHYVTAQKHNFHNDSCQDTIVEVNKWEKKVITEIHDTNNHDFIVRFDPSLIKIGVAFIFSSGNAQCDETDYSGRRPLTQNENCKDVYIDRDHFELGVWFTLNIKFIVPKNQLVSLEFHVNGRSITPQHMNFRVQEMHYYEILAFGQSEWKFNNCNGSLSTSTTYSTPRTEVKSPTLPGSILSNITFSSVPTDTTRVSDENNVSYLGSLQIIILVIGIGLLLLAVGILVLTLKIIKRKGQKRQSSPIYEPPPVIPETSPPIPERPPTAVGHSNGFSPYYIDRPSPYVYYENKGVPRDFLYGDLPYERLSYLENVSLCVTNKNVNTKRNL